MNGGIVPRVLNLSVNEGEESKSSSSVVWRLVVLKDTNVSRWRWRQHGPLKLGILPQHYTELQRKELDLNLYRS